LPSSLFFRHRDAALTRAIAGIPCTSRTSFLPLLLAAFVCASTLVLGESAQGQSTTPQNQTTSPPAAKQTYFPNIPTGINDEGVVVGDNSVFYKDGPVGLVGPLGQGINTLLAAVNNRGQVLLAQNFGGLRYFICNPVPRECSPVGLVGQLNEGGAPKSIYVLYLTGLDDTGRVFGAYDSGHGLCGVVGLPTLGKPGDQGPPPLAPAVYTLVGCPGSGNLLIRAMNANGQITGSVNGQAFLWSNGQLTLLSFPGLEFTMGNAINEAGVVAGLFWVRNATSDDGTVSSSPVPASSQPQKSFVYDGSKFRLLLMPRGIWTYVTGINNRGQVVGFYDDGMFTTSGAYVDTSGDNHRGFIANIEKFPVAHVGATPIQGSIGEAPKSAPTNVPQN